MIYLLEDDDSIRKLVVYGLQSQGYEAQGFALPSEFWRAMDAQLPELLLLDIMLPEEDGLSILRKLRAAAPTRKLPVIILTAKNTEYDRVVGLDGGADDFISRLPQGYETELSNNGANLSQGQRQLISIARAAVADPPVMILDEATSSIDTRTEAIVQRGMDKLMEGRTVFVIAHRLSTVKNSDVIMVLDHGRIIERGSHEKLIAEKGTYYQLYTGAFELE